MAIKSTLKNMILVLMVVSLVASAVLAGIFVLTKDIVEQTKNKKINEAIGLVIPGYDQATSIQVDTVLALDAKFTEKSKKNDTINNQLYFYIVKNGEKVIGTAARTFTNNGFSGHIEVMVGFDVNGNILESDVLEHHETPGLGDKTSRSVSKWNTQFNNKNPQAANFKTKKDGGEIDAITAATISSRAYIDALKRASDAYEKYIKNKIMEETHNE